MNPELWDRSAKLLASELFVFAWWSLYVAAWFLFLWILKQEYRKRHDT